MSKSARARNDGMVRGSAKEVRPWLKQALREGWTLERRGGPVMLVAPDGHREPVPTSANSRGLIVKFRKVLADHGLVLP